VADQTLAGSDRRVGGLSDEPGLIVAGEAKGGRIQYEQPGVLRRVGVVAARAAHADSGMHVLPGKYRLVMTSVT